MRLRQPFVSAIGRNPRPEYLASDSEIASCRQGLDLTWKTLHRHWCRRGVDNIGISREIGRKIEIP